MPSMNKVQQGQSFIDMVVQQSGSFDEIINAAILNNKSITDDLVIGEVINVTRILNEDNVRLFRSKQPATALSPGSIIPGPGGIGYMIIEETFIVE